MVFSSNYIYDTKIELDNISRYIAVKQVLKAKDIMQAIDILEHINVASAFSYNIVDSKNNRACNVEKDIDKIYLTKIDDRYARANHFTTRKFDIDTVPPSSKFRDKKVNDDIKLLQNNNVTLKDLQDILSYSSDDYYQSVYKESKKYKDVSVTVANFSYDGSLHKIYIKDYLDNSELIFQL